MHSQMAKTTKKNPNPLIVLLFLSNLLSLTSAISETELDAAIAALRSRGYHLFGNAITTSDVRLSLLLSNSNASYTLFAPTDAALFSLDMTSSASTYVTALRYHVALGLYSHPHLRSLPHRSSLRTLVPFRDILISHRRSSENSDLVTVDGIDVRHPDVYYGQDLVVHGLNGILPLHRKPFSASSPDLAPVRSPKSGVSPPISKKSGISPSTSPHSSHSPSNSQRSVFSPSTAPDSSHSPSISPRSAFSPTIAPDSGHSPSISRSSGVSPLIKQSSDASPSNSPDSSVSPSISQESGFSPSTAPESGRSHFGSANPPDLRSLVISPSIGAPIKGRILFSEESESSAGIPSAKASSATAMGFSWSNCDIGGHGKVSCQLVQDDSL